MYRHSGELPSDTRNNPTPSSVSHALHVQLTAGCANYAIHFYHYFVYLRIIDAMRCRPPPSSPPPPPQPPHHQHHQYCRRPTTASNSHLIILSDHRSDSGGASTPDIEAPSIQRATGAKIDDGADALERVSPTLSSFLCFCKAFQVKAALSRKPDSIGVISGTGAVPVRILQR
jgi:hypothetical protein